MIKRAIPVVFGAAALFYAAVPVKAAQGAKTPFLPDIAVKKEAVPAAPSPTPLVKKTGSSAPSKARTAFRTTLPALREIELPEVSGIIIESARGRVIFESYPNKAFNPASNVKIATAYAVLKAFGPDYRFQTDVFTDGTVDTETAALKGNLYVTGRDPVFNLEHAVALANELNRIGIRKIEGRVFVTSGFMMGLRRSSSRSAALLSKTMDGATRSAAANKAWSRYLENSGRRLSGSIVPSVAMTEAPEVGDLPSDARLLFSHDSSPMREILKVTLSYSNNFLSARLGAMVGGPKAVARIVRRDTRTSPGEFALETSSGLGINRVTPKAQLRLLKATKDLLRRYDMTFVDIMPVAGIDDGTLRNRFDGELNKGSVVAKTGTLRRTDRGVSSLSGEISTARGKFYFVIFNQGGSVNAFRGFQNMLIPLLQDELGGPRQLRYAGQSLERRLARSRIRSSRLSRFSP